MTLVLHRAERADVLAEVLAGELAVPPADPFTREVVAVHSRGVERWLAHRMSAHLGTSPGRADGVCAHLEFPFPGRLVQRALAEVSAIDPDRDPWRPERLAWPLLDVVDANLTEDWLFVLAGHLGAAETALTSTERNQPHDGRPDAPGSSQRSASAGIPGAAPTSIERNQPHDGRRDAPGSSQRSAGAEVDLARRDRRFAAVRHLADLYDRYGVHRPAMVLAWNEGRDEDGDGKPLDPHVAWQAELWRRLRAEVGTQSPTERTAAGCVALVAESDQPRRFPASALLAAASAGEDGDDPSAEVSVVDLPAGPALRHRRRVDARAFDRTVECDNVSYVLPVPRVHRTLFLEFSTPTLPVADAMAGIFDAVATTVRWVW